MPVISVRPNFDDQPSGPYFTWKDNSDGYLPCVVNANPAPVFEWRKGPSRRITDADPFFSIVNTRDEEKYQSTSKLMVSQTTWMKAFRIIPEFRILRLTSHRKSASKC